MVGISSWNMILISNDFCHNSKMYNFDPYNVLLSIATNKLRLCSRVIYAINDVLNDARWL